MPPKRKKKKKPLTVRTKRKKESNPEVSVNSKFTPFSELRIIVMKSTIRVLIKIDE